MNTKSHQLEALRENYKRGKLEEQEIEKNPLLQFDRWFQEAINAQIPEPNAMVLATCSKDGFPSARVVLLKGFDDDGFVFYTNYHSRKGEELSENPRAALNFNWLELERQIRIKGTVSRLPEAVSTAYFQKRPKGSQIGAWASPQSSPIDSRTFLEMNTRQLEAQYENAENLPRPPHWGGYCVTPTSIEFWQGRASRLHDRLLFTKQKNTWKIERLAP